MASQQGIGAGRHGDVSCVCAVRRTKRRVSEPKGRWDQGCLGVANLRYPRRATNTPVRDPLPALFSRWSRKGRGFWERDELPEACGGGLDSTGTGQSNAISLVPWSSLSLSLSLSFSLCLLSRSACLERPHLPQQQHGAATKRRQTSNMAETEPTVAMIVQVRHVTQWVAAQHQQQPQQLLQQRSSTGQEGKIEKIGGNRYHNWSESEPAKSTSRER